MSLSWFKYQWYKCLISIFIFSLIFSQDQTVGLFINDSASYVGYTLFSPLFSTSTYLIDNNGLLVHEWESDYSPAMTAYLLENGNLIKWLFTENEGPCWRIPFPFVREYSVVRLKCETSVRPGTNGPRVLPTILLFSGFQILHENCRKINLVVGKQMSFVEIPHNHTQNALCSPLR